MEDGTCWGWKNIFEAKPGQEKNKVSDVIGWNISLGMWSGSGILSVGKEEEERTREKTEALYGKISQVSIEG